MINIEEEYQELDQFGKTCISKMVGVTIFTMGLG
jgi:hypothetical protein